jgi:hypothetical protein
MDGSHLYLKAAMMRQSGDTSYYYISRRLYITVFSL